jgi:maltooligosyltrehalose trehalohydrolase
VLTGEREGYYSDFGLIADLAVAMHRPYVYAGRHSTFRQRRHGRPPMGLSGSSFIAYLQNHDQLGNRALGDRIGHLVTRDRVKIGAALVLLSPFVPLIFQGEEWSATSPFQYFVDFCDQPDLAAAVREGRRAEFAFESSDQAPDPLSIETFERSKLNWAELDDADHADMVRWFRALIALRGKFAGLTDGRLDAIRTYFDEGQQWLVVERGPIVILCNFARETRHPRVERLQLGRLIMSSKGSCRVEDNRVTLPGESIAVFADEDFDSDRE